MKWIYVESLAGVSKAGHDYSFVKLSDGFQTYSISNPHKIDCSKFKKGQEVKVTFTLKGDYKGNLNPVLETLS